MLMKKEKGASSSDAWDLGVGVESGLLKRDCYANKRRVDSYSLEFVGLAGGVLQLGGGAVDSI